MVYRPNRCLFYIITTKLNSHLILFTKVKGISSDNEGIILIVVRIPDLLPWHNSCLFIEIHMIESHDRMFAIENCSWLKVESHISHNGH